MNEERIKQKGSFAPMQNEASCLNLKCSSEKQGGKYLVDFLIARKQLQIAAQKHAEAFSGSSAS